MAGIIADAYYRCHKALHLVTYEAIPCVDNVLQLWHTRQQQTLSPCSGQCPTGKKPKLPTSCQNCVDWANAIEAVYYQPPQTSGSSTNTRKQLPWGNVSSSMLCRSHVEVAKAFVLRLPTKQQKPVHIAGTQKKGPAGTSSATLGTATATNPSSQPLISDFDSASLLMIMTRFSEFHKGDAGAYAVIEKVAAIRNDLSHMALKDNMHLDPQRVAQYFKDIYDFVYWLENMHSQQFASAQYVKVKLVEILMEPVTEKMKDELMLELKAVEQIEEEVKAVAKVVAGIEEKVENVVKTAEQSEMRWGLVDERLTLLSQTTNQVREEVVKSSIAAEHVENRFEEFFSAARYVEEELADVLANLAVTDDELPFDLDHCRNQLMADYRESRGRLPLLPGMPEEAADMEDIYIPQELIIKSRTLRESDKNRLQSYEGIFSLKSKDGEDLKRILITAEPGGGKSTTVSKIAHDWSKVNKPKCLSNCKLLFALDLREIKPHMTLIDAIQDQLLPRVSGKQLLSYIWLHACSIIFLLDGFDEAVWLGERSLPNSNEFKMLLRSKWLCDSLVIVTSRPHKISSYIDNFGICTRVQLTGFSRHKMREFIIKFCRRSSQFIHSSTFYSERKLHSEADNLLRHFSYKSDFQSIARIPMLLNMICMLWTEEKRLPEKARVIYEEIVLYLAKHNWAKVNTSVLNYEQLEEDVSQTLIGVGEVGLNGLLEDNEQAKVVFQEHEFEGELLVKATILGILSVERSRSKTLRVENRITFVHKTFQEFSAAKYLASLDKTDRTKFRAAIGHFSLANFSDLIYILEFCHGLSINAVEMILQHVVKVSENSKKRLTICCEYMYAWEKDPLTFALLLLAEVQSEHIYRHLQPLFRNPRLSLTVFNEGKLLSALDYFLTCQVGASDKSILGDVLDFNIDIWCNSALATQMIRKFLLCTTRLQRLELHFSSYSTIDETVVPLAESISKLHSLNQLVLGGFCNIKLGHKDCTKIIETLNNHITCNKTITHLTMIRLCFDINQMKIFLSKLTNLTSVTLSGSLFYTASAWGNAETVTLGKKVLNSIVPGKMRNLSISGPYKLQDNTLRNLLPTLYMLHIENLNNVKCKELFSALFDIGKKKFRDYKKKRSPTPLPCSHLKLICMSSDISTGVTRLLAKSFKFLPRLTVLNLRKSRISRDGMTLIAIALHYLTNLKELNLSGNAVPIDICRNLKDVPKLEKLMLRQASLNKESASELGKSLYHLPNVRRLNLYDNEIEEEGVLDLSCGIRKLKYLEELNLGGNALTDKNLTKLPFQHMKYLRHLHIGNNCMGNCSSLHFVYDMRLQRYTPRGVRTVFKNLHHLERLICLQIVLHTDWHRDFFLRDCYANCLPDIRIDQNTRNTQSLILKRKQIQSVIAFVKKGTSPKR